MLRQKVRLAVTSGAGRRHGVFKGAFWRSLGSASEGDRGEWGRWRWGRWWWFACARRGEGGVVRVVRFVVWVGEGRRSRCSIRGSRLVSAASLLSLGVAWVEVALSRDAVRLDVADVCGKRVSEARRTVR